MCCIAAGPGLTAGGLALHLVLDETVLIVVVVWWCIPSDVHVYIHNYDIYCKGSLSDVEYNYQFNFEHSHSVEDVFHADNMCSCHDPTTQMCTVNTTC